MRKPISDGTVQERVGRAIWPGDSDVRGNRYSVTAALSGQRVAIRIGLDDYVRAFAGDQLVAEDRLRPITEGWCSGRSIRAALGGRVGRAAAPGGL